MQEGNEVKLRCEISKAGASIAWKKGEKVLSDGEKYQMKQSGSMLELVIRKSQPEDSGTYSCLCAEVKSSATVIINGESHHIKTTSLYWKSAPLIDFMPPVSNPNHFQAKVEEPGSCGGGFCDAPLRAF